MICEQDAGPSCNISRVQNHRKKNRDFSTSEESESKETLTTQRCILKEHTQKRIPRWRNVHWEVDQNIHLGKSTSRKDLNKDCESISNLVSTVNEEQIVLNSDDQEDIEKLINIVLKQEGLPENFGLLFWTQLQNCARPDLEKHQRRRDPKIISLCLTLYIWSPHAYEDLKKSNFLQLPSKRLYASTKISSKSRILWGQPTVDE